jgi:DNA-binding transcriptional MerR regulator
MFQIRELSRRTGVPSKTIRYYEDIGLLAPAQRAENGYRLYGEADADRLRFIKNARALDFSLHEIAQILSARDRNNPPCTHVVELLRDHVSQIDARIRELQALRDELTHLYDEGKDLPEDIQMRTCVCHLIQVGTHGSHNHD